MSEKVFHVSGEVASFADEFYAYSDEVVDEKTFGVRVKELRHNRDEHARHAADCRKRADRLEELSEGCAARLETLLRIAAGRGIEVGDA